jgi:hypothetical protein
MSPKVGNRGRNGACGVCDEGKGLKEQRRKQARKVGKVEHTTDVLFVRALDLREYDLRYEWPEDDQSEYYYGKRQHQSNQKNAKGQDQRVRHEDGLGGTMDRW